MTSSFFQPQNEILPQTADRVPSSLRRFGTGLVEQARLRAKFAAAVAVAGGAIAAATPAMAEEAKPPSASDSLFIVTDPANNPLGVKITPEMDLVKHVDPTVECGPGCRIELRCPGGKMDGIIFQDRMEDGGISAIIDKSRGRAGLASCPGDQKPFPFVVPEYIALPSLTAIPLLPLVPPKTPPVPAASEAAAPLPPTTAPEPVAPALGDVVSPPEETAVRFAPEVDPEPPVSVSSPSAVVNAPLGIAVEAGVEIPVTSTHDLLRDPGIFVQGVGRPLDVLAGARGVLRAAWNPIAEQPASDDARFRPRNPTQRLNGHMMRATAGLLYPYEVAKSGGFSLDAEGGIDAGLAVLSVSRRKDVGMDKDGYLADIPGSDTITAVVEGHGGLTANFGERLRVALGLRYGQSPFAIQTKAGAREERAYANFTSVNAGLGFQF